MKNNRKYSDITSFEDFRLEKEKLRLRSKLIEVKLRLNYSEIRKAFSFSTLFSSLAKELVLPRISDFLGTLIKKTGKEAQPAPGNSQEE